MPASPAVYSRLFIIYDVGTTWMLIILMDLPPPDYITKKFRDIKEEHFCLDTIKSMECR